MKKKDNTKSMNNGEIDDEEVVDNEGTEDIYPPTIKFASLTKSFKIKIFNNLEHDLSTEDLNQILYNFIELNFDFYINLESMMQRIKKMGPYNKLDDKTKKLFDLIKLMKLFKVNRKNSKYNIKNR